MTRCAMTSGTGRERRSSSTPRTTAADFRKLTPLVLAQALERAGTVVCEPMARVSLEDPGRADGRRAVRAGQALGRGGAARAAR